MPTAHGQPNQNLGVCGRVIFFKAYFLMPELWYMDIKQQFRELALENCWITRAALVMR